MSYPQMLATTAIARWFAENRVNPLDFDLVLKPQSIYNGLALEGWAQDTNELVCEINAFLSDGTCLSFAGCGDHHIISLGAASYSWRATHVPSIIMNRLQGHLMINDFCISFSEDDFRVINALVSAMEDLLGDADAIS